MANEVDIGGTGTLFIDEDKGIRLEVLDTDGNPVDTTGWNVDLVISVSDFSATPTLTLHTTLTGTYNATRGVNTQRRLATFSDTDLSLFKAITYRHSWKRMDSLSKTVLAYGNFSPQKASAP